MINKATIEKYKKKYTKVLVLFDNDEPGKKAMEKYNGTMASYRSSEGNVVKVPYKGPVKDTVLHILGGIRSSMTYLNAGHLEDIYKNAIFIRVNNQHNRIYS